MNNYDLFANVEQFMKAYACKDILYFESKFADEIVLRDWNYQVTGKKSALEEYQKNFAEAENIEIQIKAIHLSENSAAAEINVVIDQVTQLSLVDVIKFNEVGKITSVVAFKGL